MNMYGDQTDYSLVLNDHTSCTIVDRDQPRVVGASARKTWIKYVLSSASLSVSVRIELPVSPDIESARHCMSGHTLRSSE